MLILSLLIFLQMPVPILTRTRAVTQTNVTYWSPFGPRQDNALLIIYPAASTMWSDFFSGQLDMTDWPIQPKDLSNFSNNPDLIVTQTQTEFGIYEVDVNNQVSFLGVPMEQTRTLGTPSATVTGSVAGCSSGQGRLVMNLKNLEEGGNSIIDSYNSFTAILSGSSGGGVTVHDGDDGNIDGSYTFPSLTGCMASGSYNLSTSFYSGTASVNLASGTVTTATLSVNYNSPSNSVPTPQGIEIKRAIAHLIDKPNFLQSSIQGGAIQNPGGSWDDIQASPAQGLPTGGSTGSQLPQSVVNEDCVEHPWFRPGNCNLVSAYNLTPDSIAGDNLGCASTTLGQSCFPSQSSNPPSKGYSGTNDLRAACDHFLLAGFTIVGTGGCLAVAQGMAHLDPKGLTVNIRIGSDPVRLAFGQIIADSINFLFGTPGNNGGGTVCYDWGIGVVGGCNPSPIYFNFAQDSGFIHTVRADENIYTGYWSLDSTPSQLYFYQSQFASSTCGGRSSFYLQNYAFWCDPSYDTQVSATTKDSTDAMALLGQAALIAHRKVMTVPLFSGINNYAALNSWNFQSKSSLVSQLGHGFQYGFWPLLNMRPVPGYVPSNSLYYASGCNPSSGCQQNLIRRGVSQTLSRINPFTSTTPWELDVLGQLYDNMLRVNPLKGGLCQTQPGGNSQCMDWMTTSHSNAVNTPLAGQSTWTWNLRNDIYWHDGQQVTSDDVCFTILSYRDIPSASFFPSVANVASCTASGAQVVQLVLTGQSLFDELNIGELPIIPHHVWAGACSWPVGSPEPSASTLSLSSCANTTFDPVAAGMMVGSGPWVCDSFAGVSTIAGQQSCTQNANGSQGTQVVSPGGRILLKRYLGYMRCCDNVQAPENGLATTNLQALEWADGNKDGKVTILDIAAAAAVQGSYDPYWAHPLYSGNPSTNTVDIGDIGYISFEFGNGMTSPYLGTPTGSTASHTATPNPNLTGLDPTTDPFRLDLGGGKAVYYLGATGTVTELAILSGTVSPSDFIAKITPQNPSIPPVSTTGQSSLQSRVNFNFGTQTYSCSNVILTYQGSTVFTVRIGC